MKKILIATNVLLLGIVFFFACTSSEKKPVADSPDTSTIMEAGKIPSDSCAVKALKDYSDPEINGTIDARVAKRMSEAYARDAFKGYVSNEILGSRSTGKDALCIWFELGKIKQLISTIENSVCQKDCKNNLNLGIRIYYAQYPKETGTDAAPEDLKFLPRSYARHHTVFMVGTYDNRKGDHVDFDPLNVGIDKCVPTPYSVLLKNSGKKHKILTLTNKISAVAFSDTTVNHGDLMPPPDGSGIFPTGGN